MVSTSSSESAFYADSEEEGVNSCDGALFVNLPDENEPQCWNNQVGDNDVNELLCFVSNKMDVMTQDLLVKLCTDFYGKGVIENANKLVFAKCKSLNLDITLPRFVRRQGHKKKQSDVLDIIGLCHEVGSKLPVFVARDLSNLPSVSANSFDDVASLMRDTEEMKLHLLGLADMSRLSKEINHAVNSITNVRAVERERAPAVADQAPIDVDSCLSAKTCRVSDVDSCPSAKTRRAIDVDSCPSAKTRRAIDVDSCPSAKTRRAIDVDSCPSAKTRRAIDVDSSPPSKTRRAIDADSCPSVTTCRAINVDSCPSVTTCRVSDVHSRSSDQDDDGTPFDTTSAVCTGVIDNGCNPVFVCGSLRVSNSTSVGRKNHDVDPKARCRVSDVDSCPSAKTRRAIDVDSCPSAKTRRAIDVDSFPSAKTRRAIDVDSSPPSKTRRAIDADSCPSVTTCRAINVDSCPSVTTCRVSDVHSRSSDQDDDGTPFDTTSAVCTGVIDNGCNPVYVCGSLRVSNSTSVGRKNHDVDPKAREPEPSDTVAVAVNSLPPAEV